MNPLRALRQGGLGRRRQIGLLLAAVVAGAGILLLWVVRDTQQVRDRIVAALNERFAAKLAVDALDVALLPRPRVAGSGLVLRHRGRTDVPPLITIRAFESSASVGGLLRRPVHLRDVTLDGLEIYVPPGGLSAEPRDDAPHVAHADAPSPILIDRIESRSARLQIASRRAGRLPRVFEIHDLVMENFGVPGGARFQAGITNPVPKGRVETTGTFGPWHADEPGLTPIRGDYTFRDADLDVIKGIGGRLSSVGTYRGRLERIDVEGQTETPDFSIDLARQPVPLSTRYTAVVDGTNGDTTLEKVVATLGQTQILASGTVARTEDVKGRHIALQVQIKDGRIEDLLRLAVKAAQAPLTGRVMLETSFLLPAGQGDVVDRLELDGRFRLAQARFSNVDVQQQITRLSLKGRGNEAAIPAGHSVVSNLGGRFVMKDARLTFHDLVFGVPGAVVQLSGTYDLHAETIDFAGFLLTDATLSDMTSGLTSVFVRLAQPLFRRPGGGSKLPIRISGPRAKPSFGLDVRRVFRRG